MVKGKVIKFETYQVCKTYQQKQKCFRTFLPLNIFDR